MFHAVDGSPPWGFPLDGVPLEHNISRPPTTQANAIENFAPPNARKQKMKRIGPGGIAFMVGGGTLLVTGLALFLAIHFNKIHTERQKSFVFGSNRHSPLPSHPISAANGETLLVKTKNQY